MLAALRKGQDFFQVMAPDAASLLPHLVVEFSPSSRSRFFFFAKVTKSATLPRVFFVEETLEKANLLEIRTHGACSTLYTRPIRRGETSRDIFRAEDRMQTAARAIPSYLY